MMTPDFLRSKFQAGQAYDEYVAAGTPDQRENWARQSRRADLTDRQRQLLSGFTRRLNVLITSGLWCGDCATQVPLLSQIANAAPVVTLRILDRDEHLDLAEQVRICGGLRVPTVLFLNEDFEFVSIRADKSLSRLRSRAAKSLGPSCPLPGEVVDADEAAATLADWVREFEYSHLLVRLSPKLRERHQD